MHPLIEEHGKEFISELLDMVLIAKHRDSNIWRSFLLRHGKIKRTTNTIRPYTNTTTVRSEWGYDNFGQWNRIQVEPYTKYGVVMKNGQGREVLRLEFKSIDIPQLLEESK